jgi:glycosyltransferase involved in cell wall biosynthesis
VLSPDGWPEGLACAAWSPIDHRPIPQAVLAVLRHERVRPIAMSRYALEQMRTAGLDPVYVPHAVDTTMFRPQPEIKDAVRDELDIPRDAFLVGMVAANIGNPALPRKAFPQAFLAFAELARRHDDAWLYVHTDATPNDSGINLDRLAEAVGLPRGRVRFPLKQAFQLGIPRQHVAFTYQAFDVLLSPSMGEGFGIPILEAQACGVPVIASDHSAMTELTEAGWLVGGDPWWDALQESFFLCPHVDQIADALELAYQHAGDTELRQRATEFAVGYDADLIAETYWRPALAALLDQELAEAVA